MWLARSNASQLLRKKNPVSALTPVLHASLLRLSFLFFPHVGLFLWTLWGQTHGEHSCCSIHIGELVSREYSRSWFILPLHQQSSLVPLEDSFSGCGGNSELCPLVVMPTLVRNASWIPVSWLRDCESFILIHAPQFLIIFFLNAWDRARNMRDTAWLCWGGLKG